MKKNLLLLFIFISSNVVFAQNSNNKVFVENFLNNLKNEKFELAYKEFDSTITSQFTLTQLKDIWKDLKSQYGEMIDFSEPKVTELTTNTIFLYPINFKNGGLNAQISVTIFNKINGFFLSIRPESNIYTPPNYIDNSKLLESNMTFGEPLFELNATLTYPKDQNNMPVVILVHGSGPHDRDESIGPNKPFKDLALGLATRDIAVFRYDKRTFAHANKIKIDSFNLNMEVVDDVIYAIKFLEENASKLKIDKKRIFVLGHSMGGSLIPRIYKKDNIVKGYISFAGATKTIDQSLIEQTYYISNLDSVINDQEKELIETLKRQLSNALDPKLTINTPADSLPMGIHPYYWLDFRSLNTKREASVIRKPILVLQGLTDYQVTVDDFNGWKEALKDNEQAKFISYPELNHLFMKTQGIKSRPQEYYQPQSIDLRVIDDIANWIKNIN